MPGYTKLSATILDSSVWEEDVYTRITWVAFLAKSDAQGRVIATDESMARAANIPRRQFNDAVTTLESPDPRSRTPADEGRRVKRIPGGWQIINYLLYRQGPTKSDKQSDDDARREYKRQWDRDHRPSGHQRLKKAKSDTKSDQSDTSPTGPTQAEAEAEAYKPHSPLSEDIVAFDKFWQLYPRKVGKGAAKKAWARLNPDDDLVRRILEAVSEQRDSVQWARDGGQYIPHPTTWLNQERWEDELEPLYHDPTAEEADAFFARRKAENEGDDVGHD